MTREEAMTAYDLIPRPLIRIGVLEFGDDAEMRLVTINGRTIVLQRFYDSSETELCYQTVRELKDALGIKEEVKS